MANLYNPQQMGGGMPSELPVNNQIPLIKRPTNFSMPSYQSPVDEELTAQPQSTLEAFRQSVLNPPQRTRMTYPKSTLAGLTEALKIAAEPSPLEKNRTYVNGQAYQKQQVYTDPVTKEKKFITNVREPSFGSQVMRAMPAAVSGAVDIANQPYEDAVSDWEMMNKGLAAASSAESQMALAEQRRATAGAIPEKLAQGSRALDIRQMDAETRQRLAQLKDLSDSEKMQLLQDGRISLEELKASNQYTIQELRGEQRTGQIEQQGKIRTGQIEQQGDIRTGQITQQGKIRTGQIEQQGDIRSGQITQQGNIRSGQIAQQGDLTTEQIAQRAEEARKTKQVPPGGAGTTGQLPTQQKVALQKKVTQITNQHPEWSDYISYNDQGFPVIEPPSTGWFGGGPDKKTYDAIYDSIYGEQAAPIEPPKPTAKPTPKSVTKPVTTQPVQVPPPKTPGVQPIIQHSQSTNQYRISYDGGKTWRPYNPSGKQ